MKVRSWLVRFGFPAFVVAALVGGGMTSSSASGYRLPEGGGKVAEEAGQELQKLSKGLSAISRRASQAVVFVSIEKAMPNQPMGMIDPFEFFFGPGGRGMPGMPQGKAPRGGKRAPKQEGLGSGFFVDLEKGYVLTNNHVVEGADEIHLKLADGQTYEGKVVGRDANTDLAVVQVKDSKFKRQGLAALTLGDSDDVSVGEIVIALGAPFGLEASVSMGVVSAVGRGALDIAKMGNFIQTDAAINPGNSGGPLLNTQGQVVGINTAIFSRSGGYAGIGFAVPSAIVRQVAEQLINDGKIQRGYIGCGLSNDLDPEMAQELGLPEGVQGALVSEVVRGGPAQKAGIEAGDLITSINGKPVRNASDLVNTVGLMRPGTSVEAAVYRNGKKKNVTIRISNFPDENTLAQQETSSDSLYPFGMKLAPVSPALAKQFRFESKSGAVVIETDDQGGAAEAGLEPGDVIVGVGVTKVGSPKDFAAAAKGKERILVRVEREGKFLFVKIRK